MGQVGQLRTKTFIGTASTTPRVINAQADGVKYDYIIIKVEASSAGPVMVNEGSTADLAAAIYPTAGTDDASVVPQLGATVLPGHTETYRFMNQNNGFVGWVSTGAGVVHFKLGVDP